MSYVSKLKALHVVNVNPSVKGWLSTYEVGATLWIIKDLSGKYRQPYAVTIKAAAPVDSTGYSPAYLVEVCTHIADYFDHVSSTFDIIGSSEEEVLDRAASILESQALVAERWKKLFTDRKV